MTGFDDLRHPDKSPSVIAMFIYLMIGPGLWGLHLTLVYSAHTLICALGGSSDLSATFVLIATFLVAGPLLAIIVMQRRFGRLLGLDDRLSGRTIYDAISRFTSVLSLAGILWAGAAAAIVTSCAQGR